MMCQAALDIKAAADAGGKNMCWKGHSMGCYLLLNVVDRLRWKGEDLQTLFGRLILDAPDVPTWFFRSMTKVQCGAVQCRAVHAPALYQRKDKKSR